MSDKAQRMQFIDSTFDIESGAFPTELEDAFFKGCIFVFRRPKAPDDLPETDE